MTAIVDNGFARVTKETLVRNPSTPGAITGDTIAYNSSLTINEKISTITGEDLTAVNVINVPSGNLVSTNVQDALNELQSDIDTKILSNTAIVGSTKTKITYDAKGLVTSGADATTADIADSLNKRYVTDANLTTIGNQSGTNTGDQTSIVGITGTIAQFNTACTDADFATGGGTATGTNTGDNATNTSYTTLATTLSTTNTWSAVQTFLSGMMGLRNVANTFTSFFTNTNTASRTYTLQDSSDTLVGRATTDTLTNKRINPRLTQAADYTTSVTMDFDLYDEYDITAQAGALLFNNPSGTPVNGQKRMVRIKDNGTARALTYGTQFASGSATLLTTTVISKKSWMGFEWDSTDSKYYCIAAGTQP